MSVDGWFGTLDALIEASSAGGVPDYLARLIFDEGELVTASMELLLRRRGAVLETHPIKGTRPRGRTETRIVNSQPSSMPTPRSVPSWR